MRLKLPLRPIAGLLALTLLVQVGCAGGPKQLSRQDLVDPDPARSYRVTTRDGQNHTFIALHLEGDDLVGTVRITTVETAGEGSESGGNVTNRYEERRLPWTEIQGVEADPTGRGGSRAVYMVLGAIAVGVGAFLILSNDSEPDPPVNGGNGKEF